MGDTTRKHSVMLQDNSSDSEFARNAKKTTETVCKEASSNDFFNALHNKFTKKHDGQRMQRLKAYREDSNNIMQSLTEAASVWMARLVLIFFLKWEEIKNFCGNSSVVVSWIKNY